VRDAQIKAGIDPESEPAKQDQRKAAIANGMIEGGVEGATSLIPGKWLGRLIPGSAVKTGAKTVERAIVDYVEKRGLGSLAKEALLDLAKAYPIEMGTEFVQGAGEAAVEKHYGVKQETSPMEQGWQGIRAAFGMTTLMAPLSLLGIHTQIKRHNAISEAFTNPDIAVPQRQAAVDAVHAELEKIDKPAADEWHDLASAAVDRGEAIPVQETPPGVQSSGPSVQSDGGPTRLEVPPEAASVARHSAEAELPEAADDADAANIAALAAAGRGETGPAIPTTAGKNLTGTAAARSVVSSFPTPPAASPPSSQGQRPKPQVPSPARRQENVSINGQGPYVVVSRSQDGKTLTLFDPRDTARGEFNVPAAITRAEEIGRASCRDRVLREV
jgi:hypothetical protein